MKRLSDVCVGSGQKARILRQGGRKLTTPSCERHVDRCHVAPVPGLSARRGDPSPVEASS